VDIVQQSSDLGNPAPVNPFHPPIATPASPPPLRHTNTGIGGLSPDRLDQLRAKYERLRTDRAAPPAVKRYARCVIAEIRAAGEGRAA
jgi:hypothetical protein